MSMIILRVMISMMSMISTMNMMSMILDLGFVALLHVDVHPLLHCFNPPYLHDPIQDDGFPLALNNLMSNLCIVDPHGHCECFENKMYKCYAMY